MKSEKFIKIKDFLLLKTMYSKIILTYMVFSLVLFLFMNLAITSAITRLEENLMSQRLQSDINYIEDLISNNSKFEWQIKGDKIYFGDVLIGDGTEEKANLEPFLEHERKTGTFAYVFMLDKNAELGYVEETETSAGYEEGHYLRVAGSTKSPEGKSIVGTYITKNVADSLDNIGTYSGEANVAGGMIYCLYNRLSDKNGNTVGAIVVGRNITELKSQISYSVQNISIIMILTILICGIIIVFLTSKWTSAIKITTDYLKQIEDGIIPERPLNLKTRDEMSLISESVNKMVISLKENTNLRKKSETDALTNIPNRFAYEDYSKNIYNQLLKNHQTLSIEIVDIDFFKEYNDNYGHTAGDRCIKTIAKEIQSLVNIKENMFAFRYGGDEFVIIYNGYLKDEVEEIVNTLKEKIINCNIEHKYSKISDKVTITQGVCFGFFDNRHSIEDFFDMADKALYDVKNITRNDYNIVDI
ncbi:diguanylate cyclase domain-containing protein [Peptoanaerobacter stomatis]|uniref:GGDEF domain-containing protein n=1 Tax=Peptoanaerobacter stomatis TaxID=796937 RepID=G9WZ17_9FIRM|nr:diguanylate cyclase [Peptoanaerobacter stomatis]EHL16162.1 hypothetical protein HMPREF9629_01418 [Peptoanaerobacter stomatis]